MKLRGQLQIGLHMENYIICNQVASGSIKVDDDFVWEMANSIRWLSQTFKQRFKIEKFLFGDVYAAYHGGAALELVQALMEELGYDKDDEDDDENDSSHESDDQDVSDKENGTQCDNSKKPKSNNPFTSPPPPPPPAQQTHVDSFNTPVKKAPATFEMSYSQNTSIRVTSLFEDTCSQSNDVEATYFLEELTQTSCFADDPIDLLDDFKRKKMLVFLPQTHIHS